jgi:hypothetical protein
MIANVFVTHQGSISRKATQEFRFIIDLIIKRKSVQAFIRNDTEVQ